MTTTLANPVFESIANSTDSAQAVSQMVEYYREQRRPVELFEALKMQTRQRLGLPLIAPENEPRFAETVDRQLENGLLDACREVGEMLIGLGRVREGWMYLRPTGDVDLAKRLISEVPADDENSEELIQVLLYEAVDIKRGFQLLLDRNGTCNSITAFEQQIATRSKTDCQAAAWCLLRHFYRELSEAVRGDIARNEAPAKPEESLGEMLHKRAWLVTNGGYHLDTSHLAAVIRNARVLDDRESLQLAWELTQYGRRLPQQFQYPGDEPFVDFYPAHSAYFNVLLGRDVDLGLDLFKRKAIAADPARVGTEPIEVYVNLLDRSGRTKEAIDAALKYLPDTVPSQRVVPQLLELAVRCGHFQTLLDYCIRRDDLLSYTATLVASQRTASET